MQIYILSGIVACARRNEWWLKTREPKKKHCNQCYICVLREIRTYHSKCNGCWTDSFIMIGHQLNRFTFVLYAVYLCALKPSYHMNWPWPRCRQNALITTNWQMICNFHEKPTDFIEIAIQCTQFMKYNLIVHPYMNLVCIRDTAHIVWKEIVNLHENLSLK